MTRPLSLSLSLIRLANRSRSRHVRFRVTPSLSSSLSLPASLHHSPLASLSPSADLCHLVTHRPASLCISLCHLVTLSPIRRPAHPPQPGLSSKKLACQISLKHHTCQTHSSHAAHTLTINVSPTPEKKSSLRALETLQSGRKKERETGWSEHAHTRTLRVPPPQKPPKNESADRGAASLTFGMSRRSLSIAYVLTPSSSSQRSSSSSRRFIADSIIVIVMAIIIICGSSSHHQSFSSSLSFSSSS